MQKKTMKNFKVKRLMMLASMLILLVIISTSCKEDDEVLPEYVGTWFAIQTLDNYGVFTQYKDVVTFTVDGYSDLGQMYNSTTKRWVDYQLVNGSFTVSGKIVNVLVEEMGVTTFETLTNLPTGSINTYKEGDPLFEKLLLQTGQPKSYISEYSISGNELVMQTDHNDDGDYLDARETIIFTRQ